MRFRHEGKTDEVFLAFVLSLYSGDVHHKSRSSASRKATGRYSMRSLEAIPLRTMLRIVRHCRPADEAKITAILYLADTSSRVQAAFERELEIFKLTDRMLAALVVLFTFDPEPLAPADLAYHIGLARTSIALTLEPLFATHSIVRQYGVRRRGRTTLALTPKGLALAGRAVQHFLELAAKFGRGLDPRAQQVVSAACDQVRRTTATLTAATSGKSRTHTSA
jgi:DNA-binding MarR family transcriptional regulator